MKIGIDARFLTHPQRGGFKTYTESLVGALADVDTENEYILYLDRLPDRETKLARRPNFTARVVPGSLPVVGMPWREQVGLSRQAARDRLDLLHSPSLTAPLRLSCPSVVTIHDMIWYFPRKFSENRERSLRRKLITDYYRLMPWYAARRATAVLTDSQFAKNDIVKHLGLADEKVFVTHLAASKVFRETNDTQQIGAIRRKFKLPSEFVLAIGAADPRKNIETLVLAYSLLPASIRERFPLVIVWAHPFLAEEINRWAGKLGLRNEIHSRGWASLEDMALIYNAASLFVFPSLHEGFGMPLVEAMACGTPVVASNNSSIPEIVGDAALLVEAKDAEAMASMMRCALTDQLVRATLIKKGLERAATFSWDTCARLTIAAYKHALCMPKVPGDGLDAQPVGSSRV